MPPLVRLAVPVAALVGLAGCGGGSHPTASAGATVTATSPVTSPLPSTTAGASTQRHTDTRAATATTSTSGGVTTPGSGGAGLGPAAVPSASTRSAGGGSINARVPALFELTGSGALSPAQVSVPAFLAVAIQIRSASSRAHVAIVETPHPVRLQVPPRGRSLTTIPGLRAGTYEIRIDGARRGALVIGGEPGP